MSRNVARQQIATPRSVWQTKMDGRHSRREYALALSLRNGAKLELARFGVDAPSARQDRALALATTTPAASNSRRRGRAPRHRLRVDAPALDLKILIDMRGQPRGFGREEATRDGEREQSGAAQRRHDAKRGERGGVIVGVERGADRAPAPRAAARHASPRPSH